MAVFTITYRFTLAGGKDFRVAVKLDGDTLEAADPILGSPPSWTRLTFEQCPNCPLKPSIDPYCPAARRLVGVAEVAKTLDLTTPAHIEVSMPERLVVMERTLQKGLSSLLGLIMAASGCPHTRFFRPMARFHLPLATDEEALYRATSMYSLAQYYVEKEGRKADVALDGLAELYRNIQTVNASMAKRLKAAAGSDEAANALRSLDLFSHILPFDVRSSLSKLRQYFASYLEKS